MLGCLSFRARRFEDSRLWRRYARDLGAFQTFGVRLRGGLKGWPPNSDGLQPKSDGHPNSEGIHDGLFFSECTRTQGDLSTPLPCELEAGGHQKSWVHVDRLLCI